MIAESPMEPRVAKDYEYDIFISYRRIGGAPGWVNKHFVPTLIDSLALELDRPPRVFFDQQLDEGTTWPPDLGHKLAGSRVLISLWSKTYLNSVWCAMELAHMRAREAELKLRTEENPDGLITIWIIHDGEKLPGELGAIKPFEIIPYFNTRMREDSDLAMKLEEILRSKAPIIARMIERAPEFRPAWAEQAARGFYDTFKAKEVPSQDQQPSFTPR